MTSLAAGPNQGGTAPYKKTDCEKLEESNDDARKEVKSKLKDKEGKTEEETKVLAKAEGKGMTFSSVKSEIPGASGTFTGSSSKLANSLVSQNSCGDGGTSAQRMGCNKDTRETPAGTNKDADDKKKEAGVLCGGSHVHPGGGAGAHAECKIVNELSNKAPAMNGGSMLLNINWQGKNTPRSGRSGMPCQKCYEMLCHAANACNITIYICDMNQQPQEFPKNECGTASGYQNLCKKVDGNITPGRD